MLVAEHRDVKTIYPCVSGDVGGVRPAGAGDRAPGARGGEGARARATSISGCSRAWWPSCTWVWSCSCAAASPCQLPARLQERRDGAGQLDDGDHVHRSPPPRIPAQGAFSAPGVTEPGAPVVRGWGP
jgi:hypothetical protein